MTTQDDLPIVRRLTRTSREMVMGREVNPLVNPDGPEAAELLKYLYAELNEARMALKRIEQEPRTPTKMRDIAGARAHYAEEVLARARGNQ